MRPLGGSDPLLHFSFVLVIQLMQSLSVKEVIRLYQSRSHPPLKDLKTEPVDDLNLSA